MYWMITSFGFQSLPLMARTMTISETTPAHAYPTFLPYLPSGRSGIHIDFMPQPKVSEKGNSAFPFETLDLQDPLTHAIKASLKTDAGSKIVDLLVLLQNDRPHPPKDLLPESTNPAVEQLWKQAFDRLSQDSAFDKIFHPLSAQKTTGGRLIPFRSLLYCTFKKQFFHPPCPLCGGLLDLCHDDDMLTTTGLDAYTRSLKRYLFCPTCYQLAGETDFYTSESSIKTKNSVKTVTDLILNLKNLVTSTTPTQQFPCRACSEAQGCHASDGPVGNRIASFAFYPFQLFIFRADSFDTDHLALYTLANEACPPTPKTVIKKDPQPAPNESIRLILNGLLSKWRFEASKASETDDISNTPYQTKTPEPRFVAPTVPSAQNDIADNPDMDETIIVHSDGIPKPEGADRSSLIQPGIPTNISDGIQKDPQIPETIIVNTRSLAQDDIWPKANENAINHSSLSALKNKDLDQKRPRGDKAAILPETIIVRPGENSQPESRKAPSAKPAQSIWPEKIPDGSVGKRFTFNKTDDHLAETIIVKPKPNQKKEK